MDDKSEILRRLENNKLIDVVKNYRQYGYDDKLRDSAILILEERGISKEQLEFGGNLTNQTYNFAEEIFNSFNKNSKIAFIIYIFFLLIKIFFQINNIDQTVISFINIGIFILYMIFLIKSFLNQNQFYKIIGKDYGKDGALIYLFLGMPFYIVLFFYFQNQMKNKMKEIR